MSERAERLEALTQTTHERRAEKVRGELVELAAVRDEYEAAHAVAVEGLEELTTLEVEQPKGRKTAGRPDKDTLRDARRTLADIGRETVGNASDDGGWGPLHPGDDPRIWLPRYTARIRKLASQQAAWKLYVDDQTETLREHADALTAALESKLETAASERDGLAGRIEQAATAIAARRGELAELEAGVQAPAEGVRHGEPV